MAKRRGRMADIIARLGADTEKERSDAWVELIDIEWKRGLAGSKLYGTGMQPIIDALGEAVERRNWNQVHGCICTLMYGYKDLAVAAVPHLITVVRIGGCARDRGRPLNCRYDALLYLQDLARVIPKAHLPTLIETLILAMRVDRSRKVRWAAAQLVAYCGGPQVVEDLMQDDDPEVRRLIREAVNSREWRRW